MPLGEFLAKFLRPGNSSDDEFAVVFAGALTRPFGLRVNLSDDKFVRLIIVGCSGFCLTAKNCFCVLFEPLARSFCGVSFFRV